MPKGTFRDCKQSPRSRASPDFGSLPIQKNRPYRSRNKDGYFRGTTLIHRIAEHRRFQSHSGTITYTTPSQPTYHLPFYIRGNGFSCTAGQTSFQCEAPGCIHRFVSRASHQPAAFLSSRSPVTSSLQSLYNMKHILAYTSSFVKSRLHIDQPQILHRSFFNDSSCKSINIRFAFPTSPASVCQMSNSGKPGIPIGTSSLRNSILLSVTFLPDI